MSRRAGAGGRGSGEDPASLADSGAGRGHTSSRRSLSPSSSGSPSLQRDRDRRYLDRTTHGARLGAVSRASYSTSFCPSLSLTSLDSSHPSALVAPGLGGLGVDAPSGPSGPHSSLLDPILPVPPVPPIPTPPDRSCDLPGSPQIAQVAQSQDAHTAGAGPEPGPGGPLHPFAFARSCVRDGCGGCVAGTSGLHPSLHLHSTSLVGITSRPAGLALPDSPDSPRPHLSLTASPTAALTSACCSLPVSPSSTSAVLPRLSTAVPTSASCTLPSSPSPASAVLPSLTTPADPSASSSLLLGSPAPLASQSQPSAPLSGSPSPAASHRSSFDASFSPDLPSSSQATDQPSSWPSDPMTPPSSHPSLPSTDPDYTGPTPTSSPSRQSPSPVDSPSRLPIDPDDPHAPEPLAPESLESTPLSQGRPSRPPLRPAAEEARSRFQPAALRTRVRPVPRLRSQMVKNS